MRRRSVRGRHATARRADAGVATSSRLDSTRTLPPARMRPPRAYEKRRTSSPTNPPPPDRRICPRGGAVSKPRYLRIEAIEAPATQRVATPSLRATLAGARSLAPLLEVSPGLPDEAVKPFVAAVNGLTSAAHGRLDVLDREESCAPPVRGMRSFFGHGASLSDAQPGRVACAGQRGRIGVARGPGWSYLPVRSASPVPGGKAAASAFGPMHQ
jgi:hypothetical protein